MKNKNLKKFLLCLLAVLAIFALSACDSGDGNTPGGDETPTGEIKYTVKLTDYKGEPANFKDIVVEFYKEGSDEPVATRMVSKSGTVSAKLDSGKYTFRIILNEGVKSHYDEASCVLTADKPETEVVVYQIPAETQYTVYPPFRNENGDETRNEPYNPKVFGVGGYYAELDRTDMSYFLFAADKGGVYRIGTTDKTVDIGYYGDPNVIQNRKLLETKDGAFEINILQSSLGEGSIGMIVVGISSNDVKNVILTAERIGDIPPGPPEKIIQAEQLPGNFGKVDYLNHRLVNVSVTDRNAKVVYNESDGYYHFGNENGPIVYVRVASSSPYGLAAFSEIETRLWKNIYDENGEIVEQWIYNDLIKFYEAICDQNGICPLTTEFMNMIKNVGEQFGWWDFESEGRNIFAYDSDGNQTDVNELTIVKGNEWMFPLCYVEEFVFGVDSPIKVLPVADKNYSVMVRENGAVSFVSTKAATLIIKDADGIAVNYGGSVYTALDGEIRVVLKAGELGFSLTGPDRASVSFTFESVGVYVTPRENIDFAITVDAEKASAIVIDKTATLVIENAEGLTVTYAGAVYSPDENGQIKVVITAEDMEFFVESNEKKYVEYTFVNVNK